MKISTKAATFLSSIKTQTYDKKEREMIITYQQKRVFHLSLLMLALCAPIYIYSVPFPNEQFYYINSVLFLFIIMCTLAYFSKSDHDLFHYTDSHTYRKFYRDNLLLNM